MAIVVPSRFSLLKMVEDDYLPSKSKENNKCKKTDNKTKKTDDKKSKNPKNNTNKNNKTANGVKKKNQPSHDKKDVEIDEKFDKDLQQALLLSKLELEDVSGNDIREDCLSASREQQFQVQGNGKKQKKKSGTPDIHHELLDDNKNEMNVEAAEKPQTEDPLVGLRIKKEIKNETNRNTSRKKREPPSNEEIKGSQLQSLLEKKEKEISDLKLEIVALKNELLTVKSRNKKLCNIIGQGEMKDKAEALAEVEKLREMQTELTGTIASLHAELEQARSKGSSTAKVDTKFKDKKNMKKHVRFNESS